MDRLAEIHITTLVTRQLKTARIHPQLLHDRSMNICDIARDLGRMESEFIASTVNDSAFDSSMANKHHETSSSGHRFSFGHYDAKFQWRPDLGMDLAIGHGHAIEDTSFKIEKRKWYHVTAEIRGDEILVWFKDGPAYFLQHEAIRDRPSGWEFFTHLSEIGYLDNLKVWTLVKGEQAEWKDLKAEIAGKKRAFLSSERPDFVITKEKKNR